MQPKKTDLSMICSGWILPLNMKEAVWWHPVNVWRAGNAAHRSGPITFARPDKSRYRLVLLQLLSRHCNLCFQHDKTESWEPLVWVALTTTFSAWDTLPIYFTCNAIHVSASSALQFRNRTLDFKHVTVFFKTYVQLMIFNNYFVVIFCHYIVCDIANSWCYDEINIK